MKAKKEGDGQTEIVEGVREEGERKGEGKWDLPKKPAWLWKGISFSNGEM